MSVLRAGEQKESSVVIEHRSHITSKLILAYLCMESMAELIAWGMANQREVRYKLLKMILVVLGLSCDPAPPSGHRNPDDDSSHVIPIQSGCVGMSQGQEQCMSLHLIACMPSSGCCSLSAELYSHKVAGSIARISFTVIRRLFSSRNGMQGHY